MTLDNTKLTDVIAPYFFDVYRDIKAHKHTHYWLKGGRGSTKSSFISLAIIMLILTHKDANALIIRKVSSTVRDSVYAQLSWAIEKLGLMPYFRFYKMPAEIVFKPTGQRIVFRGLDDPLKIKSLKFAKGYCAVTWFEELDQFANMEEIRSVLNSTRRGGEVFWIFYSYNPPRSAWSWVNREALVMAQRDDALVHHSTYLDIVDDHADWIGQPFVDEAETLKKFNPAAYEWEMLGVVTGTGGMVFENLHARTITDEEIYTFDNHRNGCDFGWFPDPWRFIRCEWQGSSRTLIIFEEHSATKTLPRDTGRIIQDALTFKNQPADKEAIYHAEPIWCDDTADGKTHMATYKREYGLNARPAKKGNARKLSYEWLAGLREIVIDPKRTPLTYEEFALCEYAKDRNGDWIEDFNDGHDHSIDAVRYAMMNEVLRGR